MLEAREPHQRLSTRTNGINGKGYLLHGRRGFFGFVAVDEEAVSVLDKTGNRDAGHRGAVKGRLMENVGMGKYTPVSIKTTVNGRIERNKNPELRCRSI